MNNKLIWIVALVMLLPAWAFSEEFTEGVNYKRIVPRVPTESGKKAEVVELFWYGCGHCYNMETPLHKWLKTKPDNIVFRRVPAVFSPKWGFHAQVFYTAEALGILDKVHTPFFESIHELKKKMSTKTDIQAFFKQYGVNGKDFNDAWDSFLVATKVNRAKELTKRYGINSVPTLVVNGQYITDNSMNGGPAKTMRVVNQLAKN